MSARHPSHPCPPGLQNSASLVGTAALPCRFRPTARSASQARRSYASHCSAGGGRHTGWDSPSQADRRCRHRRKHRTILQAQRNSQRHMVDTHANHSGPHPSKNDPAGMKDTGPVRWPPGTSCRYPRRTPGKPPENLQHRSQTFLLDRDHSRCCRPAPRKCLADRRRTPPAPAELRMSPPGTHCIPSCLASTSTFLANNQDTKTSRFALSPRARYPGGITNRTSQTRQPERFLDHTEDSLSLPTPLGKCQASRPRMSKSPDSPAYCLPRRRHTQYHQRTRGRTRPHTGRKLQRHSAMRTGRDRRLCTLSCLTTPEQNPQSMTHTQLHQQRLAPYPLDSRHTSSFRLRTDTSRPCKQCRHPSRSHAQRFPAHIDYNATDPPRLKMSRSCSYSMSRLLLCIPPVYRPLQKSRNTKR